MNHAEDRDLGQQQSLQCLQDNFGDLLGIQFSMVNYWAIIAPPPGKSKSQHPMAPKMHQNMVVVGGKPNVAVVLNKKQESS